MTATVEKSGRRGEYIVVNIDGDWAVLYQPDAEPDHYVRIARFTDKSRAIDYADMEYHLTDEFGDRYEVENEIKTIEPPRTNLTALVGLLKNNPDPEAKASKSSPSPSPNEGGVDADASRLAAAEQRGEADAVPAAVSPPLPEPGAQAQTNAPEGEAAVTPVPAASHPLPEPKRGPPVTKAPGNEKAVLAALKAMAATSDGLVKASYSDIGAKSGVATGSVHPAVAQLIKAGKVEITIRGEHGEKNVYRVLTEPDDAKIDQALDRAIADEKQSVQTRRTTIPPSVIPKPEERAPQRNPLLTEPLADWDSLKSPDGLTEMRGSYLIMNGKPRLLMKDEIPVMRALLSKFGQTVTHNELRMMAKKPTDTIIMLRIYLKGLPVEIEIRGDGFALVATQSAIAAQ